MNLRLESTQLEQVSHVDGHVSLTPSSRHLEAVARVATQTQFLDTILPLIATLNRNGESSHDPDVGAGAGVGDEPLYRSFWSNKLFPNVFLFGKTSSKSYSFHNQPDTGVSMRSPKVRDICIYYEQLLRTLKFDKITYSCICYSKPLSDPIP